MALENTRLERENLRIAMMNERQMMANEVHDSLAQTLAYMKMRMALMQDAMNDGDNDRACSMALDVKNALDGAYSGLRELLSQFRKRMDPLGLLHALENLADEFHDRTGVTIEYCNHITDLHLSVDQEIQVFYIVQEALANVTRHSGATEVKLTLEQKGDRYEVTIDDNGSGFFAIGNPLGSFDEHPSLKQHFGLTIMRERAQRLRGNRILRGPLAAPRGIVRQRAGPGDTGSTTQGPVQAWSASVCPANRRTALRPGFGKLLSLSNESRRPASDASGRRLVACGRACQLSPVQASDEAWPCDGSGPAERRLGARNIEQHLEAIRPEEVRSACVTQS